MPTRLISVVVDAADQARLAGFWAAALGWQVTVELDAVAVGSGDDPVWGDGGPPRLTFVAGAGPRTGKNRIHLDLVSASRRQQRDTVERLLGLGAHRLDIGQGEVPWVVLGDPEGNELCVLEPRADYRDARGIAAVVLDCRAPRALAGFWSQATGWPVTGADPQLVSLGHPEAAAATRLELLAVAQATRGDTRVRLDVAPRRGDDVGRELARLQTAGARRVETAEGGAPAVLLADPEGNELRLLPPR